LYPEHRKLVLDKHNEYRSLVAKGNATTNNGTEFMASAKNMHKLVRFRTLFYVRFQNAGLRLRLRLGLKLRLSLGLGLA
jgi:hypothetical protein